MNPSTDRDGELERVVDRALRDLPLRRAPLNLEARVRAQIERRAAASWWHKNFAHWPLAARAAFLTASLGGAYVGMRVAMWLLDSFASIRPTLELPAEVTWVHTMFTAMSMVVRDMPSLWIYGSIAAIVGIYATAFGIGATAYRTLYATR